MDVSFEFYTDESSVEIPGFDQLPDSDSDSLTSIAVNFDSILSPGVLSPSQSVFSASPLCQDQIQQQARANTAAHLSVPGSKRKLNFEACSCKLQIRWGY